MDRESSVSVWMRQLMAGDVDAPAQRLWEPYFLRLVGLARAKLGHLPRRVADEEDVALSAFHSFCAAAGQGRFPQLKDRDDLWGLLVTITARKAYQQRLRLFCQKRGGNAVLDQAALTNPKRQRGSGDAGQDSAFMSLDQFLGHEPTPEFATQAAEEYERLLAALPDPELRAIAQWKMEGFTNEEIAAKLECAIRSVERRLHVIRAVWNQPDDTGVSDDTG